MITTKFRLARITKEAVHKADWPDTEEMHVEQGEEPGDWWVTCFEPVVAIPEVIQSLLEGGARLQEVVVTEILDKGQRVTVSAPTLEQARDPRIGGTRTFSPEDEAWLADEIADLQKGVDESDRRIGKALLRDVLVLLKEAKDTLGGRKSKRAIEKLREVAQLLSDAPN